MKRNKNNPETIAVWPRAESPLINSTGQRPVNEYSFIDLASLGVASTLRRVKSKAPALQHGLWRPILALLVFALCPLAAASANTPPGVPTDTRVNLLKDAYSINASNPSFSWVVQDTDNDETQSAYRIVFSKRLSDAEAEDYLLDTDWVNSSNSTSVAVEGLSERLEPGELYYWQVQTRDKSGDESPLSAPQPFTTAVQWENTNGVWLNPEVINYGDPDAGQNNDGETFYEDIPRLTPPQTVIAPMALSKWTNYRVEQDVTITAVALGIVFRANGGDNYMWQFRADNNRLNPHYNYTSSYNSPVELSSYGVTIQQNVPFHLRIDVIGNTLTTYINDVKVDERTGRGYLSGTIGYRTGQTESGKVDNIVVANLNTGEFIYAEDFSGGTSAYDKCTVADGMLNVPTSTANYLSVENDLTTVDEKANFVFLRHAFEIADLSQVERATVTATALNTENSKQHVFELFLNGQSLGVGPARNHNNSPQGNLLYYNTYDATSLLANGGNAIAALCYNRDANRAVLLQMTVYYTDGTSAILVNSARDIAAWKGKDGTLAFGQSDEFVAPANWYSQHKEHIDATKYPFGFSEAGFTEDNTWRALKQTGSIVSGKTLVPYASENTRRYLMPVNKVAQLANGNYVVTLEKEIVGGLQLNINSPVQKRIEIRLGEDLNADGSVRSDGRGHPNYIEYWTLKPGEQSIQSLNMKNFRYVEIINSPVAITADNVKGYALRQEFDDEAAAFHSSNNFLNELYEFTKYSVKATNQDLWTDSQARERGPYEGDAIINMAASNAFSANYALGCHSHEYLIDNQTWPQEYKLFSVEMAWMDYLYTGDRTSLEKYYAKLKNKFPGTFSTSLGLVSAVYSGNSDRILIDWPESERDNYQLQAYSTGYNALYVSGCEAMANIAERTGNETDRAFYQTRANTIRAAMISKLYNSSKGAFDDSMSEGGALSGHYSQHATAYALACGIYDSPEMADKLTAYLQSQDGFRTSIYAAFFVLKGLYGADADSVALQWMANEDIENVRTWAHVIRKLNATITPEAWDPANKPNMTFSHPWGAAPAPAIAQGMFGIQPTGPAFETFQIKIRAGGVQQASIKVPTIRGGIEASYNLHGDSENGIMAEVKIPANTSAKVFLPVGSKAYAKLIVDGKTLLAERDGRFLAVTVGSGVHTLSVSDETSPYIEVSASVDNDGLLRLGKTGQVTVTAVDERNEAVDLSEASVAYGGYDAAVVTVSPSGEIDALAVGRTTITVIVQSGDLEGTASVLVSVTDQPLPGDDKIQIVELRLDTLAVGQTAVPTLAGILGDGSELVFTDVAYRSDNENIARVNADGTVALLAEGEFTLRALATEHFEKLDPAFDFNRFEITPLYETGFDDGVNPFSGTMTNMSVNNGRLFVGKSSNAVYPGGTDWTDYILTATVNPVPNTGSAVAPGGPAATFHFRANSERTQLYMWQIFSGNNLKKHINISETGSVTTVIDGMNPAGQDSRIAIAAEGNRIMTYVNGRLVDVATYTNYSQGTIGVRTGSSEEFYVDDLAVGTRKLRTSLTAVAHLPTGIPATNTPQVKITVDKGRIQAAFEGTAIVRLYSVTGLLLDEARANRLYTYTAKQGVYILSVADKSYKIINYEL